MKEQAAAHLARSTTAHTSSMLQGWSHIATLQKHHRSAIAAASALHCCAVCLQVLRCCVQQTHIRACSVWSFVCSNRHWLQRQHCFSISCVPSTLIRCIRALTSLCAYPGTRLTRVAVLTGHVLIKAVGDVDQSGNQYVLLRTLTLAMNM